MICLVDYIVMSGGDKGDGKANSTDVMFCGWELGELSVALYGIRDNFDFRDNYGSHKITGSSDRTFNRELSRGTPTRF